MRPIFAIVLAIGFAAPMRAAEGPPERKLCHEDWSQRRQGDCWVEAPVFSGRKDLAYVHPRGWVVDARCFADSRFTPAELNAALETAYRKMRPQNGLGGQGCLAEFNPEWGGELVRAVWDKRMHLSCPAFDKETATCAHHAKRDRYFTGSDGFSRRLQDYYSLLVVENAERCMGRGGSGLAGILFHESLHAAGADNFPTAKHNKAWELPQYEFVSDRVYAAEAVCFFATDPKQRKLVNFLQCKRVVEYGASAPRTDLCRAFDASFTDHRPPGFIKH